METRMGTARLETTRQNVESVIIIIIIQAIELSKKKMEELLASKNDAERADGKIHDLKVT